MPIDPELDQLSRDELVARARTLGARRPEVMTRIELRDEIVRLSETDPNVRRRSRGWLGVARDLVASVVDSGLNLPGAAAAIRGEAKTDAAEWQGPPPVATLTLAEIYLAQGHYDRALAVVTEVLANEPDHASAVALRARIEAERSGPHSRRRPGALVTEPPPTPIPPAPAPAPIAAPRAFETNVPDSDAEEQGRPTLVSEPVMSLAPDAMASPPLPLAAMPAAPHETEPAASAPDPAAASAPEPKPEAEQQFESYVPQPADVTPIPTTLSFGQQARVEAPGETAPASGAVSVVTLSGAAECALFVTPSSVEALVSLTPFVPSSILRVVWFVARVSGPERGQVDVPLDPVRTRFSLPVTPPSAYVRAAVGRQIDSTFEPLSVAWVYRARQPGLDVSFAPPGAEPLALRARIEALVAAEVG